MILATRNGDVAVRSISGMFAGIDVIPIPSVGVGQGAWSSAGRRVTPDTAVGLPGILRGIRLIAEVIGGMSIDPLIRNGHAKEYQEDSWQWELLHDQPNDTQRTPFSFKEFMIASAVGRGNAYALKAKSYGRVQALYPMPPKRVRPKYVGGGEELVYEVSDGKGRTQTLDSSVVLHMPGMLYEDPCIGMSPITVAANALGTALGAEEFAGRFFDADATPAGVISFKQQGDSQAAQDTRDTWEDRHRGSKRSHKVAALFGGAEYKQIGVDAQAAQIIETQRWSVEQSARVLNLPTWALGGTDQNPRSTPEERHLELMTFSLGPWIVRFEEAFRADDDLFPDKELVPHVNSDGLVRADMAKRYQAYLMARQGGWESADDIREQEGKPPIADGGGTDYQLTPVGGAPNLQPDTAPGGTK